LVVPAPAADSPGSEVDTARVNHDPLVDLGLVKITNTDMSGALDLLTQAVVDGKHHSFCFCEANLLSNSVGSKRLRRGNSAR